MSTNNRVISGLVENCYHAFMNYVGGLRYNAQIVWINEVCLDYLSNNGFVEKEFIIKRDKLISGLVAGVQIIRF
jgi:hypothetical protein